jgi:hypothetical protein
MSFEAVLGNKEFELVVFGGDFFNEFKKKVGLGGVNPTGHRH